MRYDCETDTEREIVRRHMIAKHKKNLALRRRREEEIRRMLGIKKKLYHYKGMRV